jgi:hypothetical protein
MIRSGSECEWLICVLLFLGYSKLSAKKNNGLFSIVYGFIEQAGKAGRAGGEGNYETFFYKIALIMPYGHYGYYPQWGISPRQGELHGREGQGRGRFLGKRTEKNQGVRDLFC